MEREAGSGKREAGQERPRRPCLFVILPFLLLAPCFLLPPQGWAQMVLPDLQHPLNLGLVSWWRGVPQLTGGDRLYDLMGRNTGTLTNMGFSASSGWSATDRRGGYAHLTFDGSDDQASIPQDPRLDFLRTDAFSIAFWCKTTSGTARGTVLYKANLSSPFQGYYVELRAGKLRWRFFDASSNAMEVETTTTVNDGLWHHYVVTLPGTALQADVRVYLDGALATVSLIGGDLFASTTTGVALVLGFYSGFPYAGALDSVAIYGRALTALEVQALYQQSLLGDPDLLRSPYGEVARGPSVGAPGSFLPFFGR